MKKTDYYSINEKAFLLNPELNQDADSIDPADGLLDAVIWTLTNKERVRLGLNPLFFHPKLREMATLHSNQMLLYHFFSHENPFEMRYKTVGDRLNTMKDKDFGGFLTYGENIAQCPTLEGNQTIAVRYDDNGTPHFYDHSGKEMRPFTCLEYAESVVKGWMNSSGHRANILNPEFEFLGCGCAKYQDTGHCVPVTYFNLTQNFGGGEIRNTKSFGGDSIAPRSKASNKNAIGGMANKTHHVMNKNFKDDATMADDGYAPDNGEEKVVTVFTLDRSGSMSGDKITKLNAAIKQFIQDIAIDPVLSQRVEVGIVAFNDKVDVLQTPTLAEEITPPTLFAGGGTNLSGAMLTSIDMVEERKAYHDSHGIPRKRSWIVPICDGHANVQNIVEKVQKGSREKHYFVQPIAVGNDADLDALNSIASTEAIKIENAGQFSHIFRWLSNSLGTIVNAAPGTKVDLANPYEGIEV